MKKLSSWESRWLAQVFNFALTWTLVMPDAVGQSRPPKRGEGEPCTLSVYCLSGFCVDGVCCESSCGGMCRACSAAKKGTGRDGTCELLKRGADPDNECAVGACSGTGTCVLDPGNACSSDTQCVLNMCVDGVCCNERCDGTCVACSEAKKGGGSSGICGPIVANIDPDNECAAGDCNGAGVCTELAANGSACVVDSECSSKRCVRGICCNRACTDDCEVCEVPGSVGTCTRICMAPTCTGTVGLPDPPFAPGFAVGEFPEAIFTADFNGDGYVDIVTSSTSPYISANIISVLLASGNNAFANHVDYPTGNAPGGIVATDWDGDGHIDIVATNPSANAVSILFNQGNGTFAAKVDMAVGAKLWQLVAADVNDDGRDDLVAIASAPSIAVVVLVNDGNGAYTFADYSTGSNPRSIRTADANGDGKTDIVAANVGGSASVLMNNGDGTFPTRVDYPIASGAKDLVVKDFTGDGVPDVVVLASSILSFLRNNGNGSFAPRVDLAVDYYDEELNATDTDLDGDTDLVLSNTRFQLNSVGVLTNQNGSFAGRSDYLPKGSLSALTVADVTGDGATDILVGNASEYVVNILPNAGDGTFTIDHATDYGTSTFAPIAVDVNNDGHVDLVGTKADIYPYGITAFINDGGGSFAESYTSDSTLPYVDFLASGDFNGDGLQDIVAAQYRQIAILLNQGDNTFVSTWRDGAQTTLTGITTGDFNGDGHLDIAYTSYDWGSSGSNGTNWFNIRMGNGDGTAGAGQTYTQYGLGTPCSGSGRTLATIDYDNDGALDLALAHCDWGYLELHRNLGNGTFAPSVFYSMTSPTGVNIADLDGNGVLDFAVTTGPGEISVIYRNGPNSSGPLVKYNVGSPHRDFVLADLDNNDMLDIAASTPYKNAITVLLNQGNGAFSAPANYLAGWGPRLMTHGDWNGDGRDDLAYETRYTVGVMMSTCSP